MATPNAADADATAVREFHALANMSAAQLERWLDTDESRAAGQKRDGEEESTGHEMGRALVRILREKRSAYDDADVARMRKAVGYIKRHLAQRPAEPDGSRWEASLKNWAHDPSQSDATKHG